MGDREKDPKQASFEERLSRARKEVPEEWQEEPPVSPLGAALKMSAELVVGSGVGAFIGYWFDTWFDTKPLFLIVLLILGFASGVRNVIRDARRMQDADEEAN
ncbi:AtpZ/AtpI family protein [Kordiimonas pumila]|uniref:ATP synthase protein I n=1 Tax=Kordiimonas pumila TaxID=2161677 RepID=A0ABV7D928_9PROT|nr:AtpZ/AtpI family protein [Kordiimonas pumila]